MQTALPADVLSRLIGSAYDCALDPGRWPDALTDIRCTLDFANAAMTVIEMPGGAMPLNIMVGPEPIWVERSALYGADVIDQWGGIDRLRALPMHEPAVLSHIRDRSLWSGNRFYREWGLPQGIHDVLAIPLTLDPAAIGSVAFGRHQSMGEIGPFEIEASTLLIPHLQRAVAIGRLLDIKSVVSSTFDAMLDTLAVGVVLVDADLGIVHANAPARAMLSAETGIRSRRGVLSLRPPAVEAALATAVREAAENEAAIGRRGFGIPAAAADGVASVLHVLPLRHGTLRPGLVPSAVAAVFVAPVTAAAPSPADALAALFDLTPGEARVFTAIAAGMTREEASRALGIAPATVKAHLSHVFGKTGTGRQAELVALNAAIALPLRA